MLTTVAMVGLLVLAGAVLTVPGRSASRGRAPVPLRGRLVSLRRRLHPRRRRGDDVGTVLVEVATRLRAGADLSTAWQRALPSPPPVWSRGVMLALGLAIASTPTPPTSWAGRRRHDRRRSRAARPEVAAAIALCRLARRTGAPLAEVIDIVVGGIDETREAGELRRTALAGPRATARLLAWLPLGGIGLGVLLGADPIAVLLGGGAGGLCLVLGAALFVAGRHWVQALVAQAERAGA